MNISQAAAKVRQQSAQEQVRSIIRQFGLDTTVEALRFVYQENVYRRAKSSVPVAARMGLLNGTVGRLQAIQEGTGERPVLRLPETA